MAGRVTSSAVEVLAQPDDALARITSAPTEVLVLPDTAQVRVTFACIEVLVGYAPQLPPPLIVSDYPVIKGSGRND